MRESLYIQSFIRYLKELDPGLTQIEEMVRIHVKPFYCSEGSDIKINQTKEILYIYRGLMAGHLISEVPRITCWFAREYELTLPGVPKYQNDKSVMQAYALEDTEGLLIPLSLFTLLSAGRIGKCIDNIIFRKFLIAASADAMMLRKSTPLKKISYFQQTHPSLANRLPDIELSSYLGISVDDLDKARQANEKE